jgi:hypothetical protein
VDVVEDVIDGYVRMVLAEGDFGVVVVPES